MLYFSSQLSIQKYKPAADSMFAALDLFNIKYKLLNNCEIYKQIALSQLSKEELENE